MASVAILAGGRATRFGGRDKSALRVDGRSILDRQLDEVAALSDDVMIVGPETAAGYAGAARYLKDRWAHCGPLGGIEVALDAARHDDVIVLACDMPFVDGGLLGFMLKALGDADAVVPRTEDGYHPLCAVYTRRCHPIVVDHLTRGDWKMMHLLNALRVRPVTRSEMDRIGRPEHLLANVNTPSAFDELETLLGHKL